MATKRKITMPQSNLSEQEREILNANLFSVTADQRDIRKTLALESIVNYLAVIMMRLDEINESLQSIDLGGSE